MPSPEANSGAEEVLPIDSELSLRQLGPADAGELYELIDNDREHLGEWMDWVDGTRDPADTAAYIAKTEQAREQGDAYGYGIIHRQQLVGHISLLNVENPGEPTKIGYWVAGIAARQGIGTRATEHVTELALDTLAVPEVAIYTAEANKASNRVAEKAGYEHVGTDYDERLGYPVNKWTKRATEE